MDTTPYIDIVVKINGFMIRDHIISNKYVKMITTCKPNKNQTSIPVKTSTKEVLKEILYVKPNLIDLILVIRIR